MKCIKCSKSAGTGLKHLGSLCNKCFLRTIEKRIRKDLTVNKVFSPYDKVLLLNDGSVKAELCMYFLKSISKDIPLKIDVKKAKPKTKYDKIVLSFNLDYVIESFLECLFTKEDYKKDKDVLLLRTVSDEEILVLKRILKLKGTVKKTRLGKQLDDLESKYPGSKFGLFRGLGI